jgi:hypothetical protein
VYCRGDALAIVAGYCRGQITPKNRMVEFNLQEEVLALQDGASYHIPGEIEVRGAAPDDIRTIFESKTRPYL